MSCSPPARGPRSATSISSATATSNCSTVRDPPGCCRTARRFPSDRTQPALDLDLLLGGLKPVIRGLDPSDVNALTNALLEIFQGQGDTMQSLLSKTSSFSNTLADNNTALEQLIDNLDTVLATLGKEGERFSGALDQFEQLTTALATDRDTIGTAIDSLSNGTASIAELLTNARPPLAGTVDQLNRLAPLLDKDKGLHRRRDTTGTGELSQARRVGSYGSFVNYYLCGITLRVTDLQGRTAVFPWVKQRDGRCAEPDAQVSQPQTRPRGVPRRRSRDVGRRSGTAARATGLVGHRHQVPRRVRRGRRTERRQRRQGLGHQGRRRHRRRAGRPRRRGDLRRRRQRAPRRSDHRTHQDRLAARARAF